MLKLNFNTINPVNIFFYDNDGLKRVVKTEKTVRGYKFTATVTNTTGGIIKLTELLTEVKGIRFGGERRDDYFYANENARLFCTLTLPIDFDRFNDDADINKTYETRVDKKWADPEAVGRICSSPYQPLHAVLLSNYNMKAGLVAGSLLEDCFSHTFEVGHDSDGSVFLKIYSEFKGVAYREIKAGETLKDEFYIGEEPCADDINENLSGYVDLLYETLKDNAGASDINRHSLIWDSWNDGIYRDVSEDMLLTEAKAVKKYFPNVEWFQLDDGYSAYCEKNVDLDAHGLGVPYEGENGIDKIKFPNGLKGYVDEVKKIGLKPSIWIGGFCPRKTKIYKEHPEWFIDYSYRLDNTAPLDPSKEDVRNYILRAFDAFFNNYGFEGVKFDFWSYAFEDGHDLSEDKSQSGYERRAWLSSELRKRLPKYGYIETGCDVSMGDPFNGKYFNNYRFGLDVGSGKWSNIKTVAFWAVAVLSAHTGGLFIPNSDSAGLLPGLDDTDFEFVINFQTITRTLVEISGKFSDVKDDNPRLKTLLRATKFLNNGERVFFANYDYRKAGEVLPEIIYIKSFFDESNDRCDCNIRTVGLFNPEEVEKTLTFTVKDVGLDDGEYVFKDCKSEKTSRGVSYTVKLKPHGSALIKVY